MISSLVLCAAVVFTSAADLPSTLYGPPPISASSPGGALGFGGQQGGLRGQSGGRFGGQPQLHLNGKVADQPERQYGGQLTYQPGSRPGGTFGKQPAGQLRTQLNRHHGTQTSGQLRTQLNRHHETQTSGQLRTQLNRQHGTQTSGEFGGAQSGGFYSGQSEAHFGGPPTEQFGGRPAGRPDGSFGGRPAGQPEGRPGGSFGGRPAGQPEGRPGGSFGGRPGGSFVGQPGYSLGGRPAGQPEGRPGGSFEGRPAGELESHPERHFGGRPAGQPGSHTGSNLSGQPGGSLHGQPGGSLHGQPGGSLHGQPGGSLHGQPGSSLHGQPGGSLHGQPGGSLHGQPGGSLHGRPGSNLHGRPGSNLHGRPGSSLRGRPGGIFGDQANVRQRYGTQSVKVEGLSVSSGAFGAPTRTSGGRTNESFGVKTDGRFGGQPSEGFRGPSGVNLEGFGSGPSRVSPSGSFGPVGPVVPILRDQRKGPDALGNYFFHLETGDGISRHEQGAPQGPTGAVASQGGWSFTYPDGTPAAFNFVADEFGYHVESDLLPTPHPLPVHAVEQIEKAQREDAVQAPLREGSFSGSSFGGLSSSSPSGFDKFPNEVFSGFPGKDFEGSYGGYESTHGGFSAGGLSDSPAGTFGAPHAAVSHRGSLFGDFNDSPSRGLTSSSPSGFSDPHTTFPGFGESSRGVEGSPGSFGGSSVSLPSRTYGAP